MTNTIHKVWAGNNIQLITKILHLLASVIMRIFTEDKSSQMEIFV